MTRVMKFIRYGALALFQAIAIPANADDKPYAIVDGKVDENTFQGWQVYQGNCGLCHGDSGQGNPASDLTERLRTISRDEFVYIVTNGRGLMPPFKSNQDVMDRIGNVYAYLKARSDGELKSGKPAKP